MKLYIIVGVFGFYNDKIKFYAWGRNLMEAVRNSGMHPKWIESSKVLLEQYVAQ